MFHQEKKVPGVYVLMIKIDTDEDLNVGRLGLVHFRSGWYVYVGSAQNGLLQRIRRHLRSEKRIHWHIDYLLSSFSLKEIWLRMAEKSLECDLSARFGEKLKNVKGFGCSDCSCTSHLFFGEYDTAIEVLKRSGLESCPLSLFEE